VFATLSNRLKWGCSNESHSPYKKRYSGCSGLQKARNGSLVLKALLSARQNKPSRMSKKKLTQIQCIEKMRLCKVQRKWGKARILHSGQTFI
jgi:hypothetical protein